LGDPQRLRQIVRNLVANGVKATDPAGRVAVRWSVVGGDVVVEVEDDGPGVPTSMEEHLFEPFMRGAPGGTGLGLGVARGWACAHGGEVTLHRFGGPGARFEVRLPCYVDDDDLHESDLVNRAGVDDRS
jgi:signal transduction histidine kinase